MTAPDAPEAVAVYKRMWQMAKLPTVVTVVATAAPALSRVSTQVPVSTALLFAVMVSPLGATVPPLLNVKLALSL